MTRAAAALRVWALLPLLACSETEPLTQIVVVVDSNWADLDRFELEVRGLGDGADFDVPVSDGSLPRTLALVHEGGELGPIEVVVSGYAAGESEAALVEPRSEIYFERDRTLLLRIDLLAGCVGRCDDERACVDDGELRCVSSEDAVELVPWTGSVDPLGTAIAAPGSDGGPTGPDAGPTDGGDAASGDDEDAATSDAAMDAEMPDGTVTTPDAGDAATDGAAEDAGGACTTTCAFTTATPHAAAEIVCRGDRCLIACDPGFVDCDGDYENGCEASVAGTCACPGRPARRKLLTVDGTRVADALADFPLLVARTADADLAAEAAENGGDICFTEGDGVTRLDFELEHFDGDTGQLLSWVRMPALDNGVSTTLYMYYGDATPLSRQTPQAVWDADYRGVYHFAGGAEGSTSDGNDGVLTGATTAAGGPLGEAASFAAMGDVINVGSDASIDGLFVNGGTIEAWIRPTSWGDMGLGRIVDKAGSNDPNGGWTFLASDVNVSEGVRFVYSYNVGDSAWNSPASSIALNTWQHVAITYDTGLGNSPLMFIDGASVSVTNSSVGTFGITTDPSYDLRIGNSGDLDRTFQGSIDEVRLSSSARSAEWIVTSHRNQSDPEGFVVAGAEESYP